MHNRVSDSFIKLFECVAPISRRFNHTVPAILVAMLGAVLAQPVWADPCNDDPCGQGCPPHPCCEIPMDPCCGTLDLCTLGVRAVTPGTSLCGSQGIHDFGSANRCNPGTRFRIPHRPPRSIDLAPSSLPLIPSQQSIRSATPNPAAEMPSHLKTVDLMFGDPLVQAVDFELPFGSATFRHVRTYVQEPYPGGIRSSPSYSDWNGLRWFMGEHALLEIDAEPEYGGQANVQSAGPTKVPQRRCNLVLDGHHIVPFLFEPAGVNSQYVAPPYYDAILQHNGMMDANGDWVAGERPTEFTVLVSRQSIKYTFTPRYEDGDFGQPWYHAPPPTGLGRPYYAYASTIEDRHGNRVELTYCDELEFDRTCLFPFIDRDYIQTCNQVGQLKTAKLWPAGATEPAYTLLYIHQPPFCLTEYMSDPECASEEFVLHRRYLRAILVYEGDYDRFDDAYCLTLPAESFCSTNSFADWDAEPYTGTTDDWIIKAEYTHAYPSLQHEGMISDYVLGSISPNTAPNDGVLVRAVVSRKESLSPSDDAVSTISHYRYEGTYAGTPAPFPLRSYYSSDTVGSLLDSVRGIPNPACLPNLPPISEPDADDTYLLTLDDTDAVYVCNEETGEYESRTMRGAATLTFAYWDEYALMDYGGAWAWTDDPPSYDPYFELLANEYGIGLDGYTFSYAGNPVFMQRIQGMGNDVDGVYRYHFMRLAIPPGDPCPSCDCPWGRNTDYSDWDARIPYYVYDYDCAEVILPDGSHRRHLAVVDRIEPGSTYDMQGSYISFQSPPALEYAGLLSRRVVDMNAQGFILRDRTWDYKEDANGDLVEQLGHAEERRYDQNGRIVEIRSSAWSSEDNAGSEATDGLVQFFEYGNCGTSGLDGELACEGIMLGTSGAKWYTARYDHGVTERPELVTQAIRFRTPAALSEVQNPDLTKHEVVKASYTLGTGQDQDSPIVKEERYSKIGSQTDTGKDIWALARKSFNDQGQMEWSGIGRFATTTADPSSPTSSDMLEFFVDRKAYNDRGQILRNVIDIDSTGAPSEFERVAPAALPPLDLATIHTYDDLGRPTRVEKPGGRNDFVVYDLIGDPYWLRETWKYEEVTFSGGAFHTDLPVTIVIQTKQGRVEEILKVRLTSFDDWPDGDESYEIISRSELEYDAYGRAIGVDAVPDASTNGDGQALEARIAYDAFGQVGREQGPNGTVMRTVRGMRGRIQKIYRGTNDRHPYWGTAIWCDPPPYDCEFPDNEFPDNMVLVEKRFYGDGTSTGGGKYATGQLVESRSYNQKPTNQYFIDDPQNPWPPNDEDDLGIPTVYEYDCRNRPVFVEERDENDVALYRTFTWYDHQDRPRLVAEYDGTGGPGATYDPRTNCYWQSGGAAYPNYPTYIDEPDVPWAKDLRGTSPFSLREMIYNSACQLAEERDYVIGGGPLKYTSTTYEFDGRGLTVTQYSPGAGTTESLYNALGRLVLQKP